MTEVSFKGKNQRFGSLGGVFTDGSGSVFIGKDWALQNEITESRERTKSRTCYVECRTCGCCSNSLRDGSSCSRQYDGNEGKTVACTNCEKFRFCDCRNGYFRDAHGDAEPFTPDVVEMMRKNGGRPLI